MPIDHRMRHRDKMRQGTHETIWANYGGSKMSSKSSGKSTYYWVTLVVLFIAFVSVAATAQV